MQQDSLRLKAIVVLVLFSLRHLAHWWPMEIAFQQPRTRTASMPNQRGQRSRLFPTPLIQTTSASFIEANRCDGGSATCTSGETYIEVDFTVQFSPNSMGLTFDGR